jgi:hypothetical protein
MLVLVIVGFLLVNGVIANFEGGCLLFAAGNIAYLGIIGIVILAFAEPRWMLSVLVTLVGMVVLAAVTWLGYVLVFSNLVDVGLVELRVLRGLRVGVATILTGYLAFSYGPAGKIHDFGDMLAALIARFLGGALVVIPIVLIVGTALALCGPPGHRREALRLFARGQGWNGPLMTVGLVLAPLVLLLAGRVLYVLLDVDIYHWPLGGLPIYQQFPAWIACFITGLLVLVGALVLMVVIAIGLPYVAVAKLFNADQANPLLPALLGPWFVVGATALQVSAGTELIATPHGVGTVVSTAAIVLSIALAAVEYRLVSRTLGVTPFTGPPRADGARWVPIAEERGAAGRPARVAAAAVFLLALPISAITTVWLGIAGN